MTIFDAIRYPVSIPPLATELKSLPKPLFEKWLAAVGWGYHSGIEELIAGNYYRDRPHGGHPDIILLRKMIAEYEPV